MHKRQFLFFYNSSEFSFGILAVARWQRLNLSLLEVSLHFQISLRCWLIPTCATLCHLWAGRWPSACGCHRSPSVSSGMLHPPGLQLLSSSGPGGDSAQGSFCLGSLLRDLPPLEGSVWDRTHRFPLCSDPMGLSFHSLLQGLAGLVQGCPVWSCGLCTPREHLAEGAPQGWVQSVHQCPVCGPRRGAFS